MDFKRQHAWLQQCTLELRVGFRPTPSLLNQAQGAVWASYCPERGYVMLQEPYLVRSVDICPIVLDEVPCPFQLI